MLKRKFPRRLSRWVFSQMLSQKRKNERSNLSRYLGLHRDRIRLCTCRHQWDKVHASLQNECLFLDADTSLLHRELSVALRCSQKSDSPCSPPIFIGLRCTAQMYHLNSYTRESFDPVKLKLLTAQTGQHGLVGSRWVRWQCVGTRKATLFRKPAGQEDGRLAS